MECNSMATLLMLEPRSHGLMQYQNVSMKLDLVKGIQNQTLGMPTNQSQSPINTSIIR